MDVEPVSSTPLSLNSDFPQAAQVYGIPQVNSATSCWTPQVVMGPPNSTCCFGPRNVFSYPVSDLTGGRFPSPQNPNFLHPFQTQGPFFPPL
ncbi:hypothetical protein FGIG_06056 [Fasciola gigantica]|uniref:Uncharacterized protein n=1 Tax=Fasciola gigantica TaxID=46835 RepID=A0A504Z961_FASGI|nr:hypothetical protein FGIG_06056 [Fasciola gigantica]